MVIAVLLSGLAAFFLVPPPARLTRLRVTVVSQQRRRWWWLAVAGVVLLVAAGMAGGSAGLSAVGAGGVLVATGTWLGYRSYQRRTRRRRSAEVVDACLVLAAEVRAGRHFAEALTVAASDFALIRPVRAAVDVGADTAVALRLAGAAPGAGGLVELARAWQISERSGASLAPTLDAIVATLRERQELAATVAAELAAPRATGQLLGLLPLAGVLLGAFLGVDPLGFLIGSTVGRLLGLVAVVLACAGLVWSDYLARDREDN